MMSIRDEIGKAYKEGFKDGAAAVGVFIILLAILGIALREIL